MDNERSLAKEITEGFEALKSMRNNEPVAWMYERPNGSAKLTFVREPMAGTVVIETPLYTHPVKEQDTDCQYCKQGCIRCDARKQLTDEEIWELHQEHIDEVTCGHSMKTVGFVEFARAILRKASEK